MPGVICMEQEQPHGLGWVWVRSWLHFFSDCRAVLHVLDQWLQHHPEDFWEPPEYPNLHKILSFLHQSAPNSPVCALAKGLLQAHKEKEVDGKNNLGPKLPSMAYLLRVSSLDPSILTSAPNNMLLEVLFSCGGVVLISHPAWSSSLKPKPNSSLPISQFTQI